MSITFKQFLNEAIVPEVSLNIHFSPGVSKFKIPASEKQELHSKFESFLHQLNFEFDVNYFNSDAIEFVLINLSEDLYADSSKIQSTYNKLKKHCQSFLTNTKTHIDDETSWAILKFTALPTKLIDWNYVEIAPHITKPISLAGVHKIIQPKESLIVANLRAVNESVLGLLKIDKDTDIYLNGTSEWSRIVRKYLTDRDIAKCQTELLKNGLKQYAKL